MLALMAVCLNKFKEMVWENQIYDIYEVENRHKGKSK